MRLTANHAKTKAERASSSFRQALGRSRIPCISRFQLLLPESWFGDCKLGFVYRHGDAGNVIDLGDADAAQCRPSHVFLGDRRFEADHVGADHDEAKTQRAELHPPPHVEADGGRKRDAGLLRAFLKGVHETEHHLGEAVAELAIPGGLIGVFLRFVAVRRRVAEQSDARLETPALFPAQVGTGQEQAGEAMSQIRLQTVGDQDAVGHETDSGLFLIAIHRLSFDREQLGFAALHDEAEGGPAFGFGEPKRAKRQERPDGVQEFNGGFKQGNGALGSLDVHSSHSMG